MLFGQQIKKRYAKDQNFIEATLLIYIYSISTQIYKFIFSLFPNVYGILIGGSSNTPSFRRGVSDVDITVYFKNEVSDRELNKAKKIHKLLCTIFPQIEIHCTPTRINEFRSYLKEQKEYLLWHEIRQETYQCIYAEDPRKEFLDIKIQEDEKKEVIRLLLRSIWFNIYNLFLDNEVSSLTFFEIKKNYYKLCKLKEYQTNSKYNVNFNQSDLNIFFQDSINVINEINLYYHEPKEIKVTFDQSIFYKKLDLEVQNLLSEIKILDKEKVIMQPFYGFNDELFIFFRSKDLPSIEWLQSIKDKAKNLKAKVFIYFVTHSSAHLAYSSIIDDEHINERFFLDYKIDTISSWCMHEMIERDIKDQSISLNSAKHLASMLYDELIFFKEEYLDNDEIYYLAANERDKLLIKSQQWELLAQSFLDTQKFHFFDMHEMTPSKPKEMQDRLSKLLQKLKDYKLDLSD